MGRLVWWLLGALACLQLLGVALDSAALRGLGAASVASPAPKVFTSAEGLETFSTRYTLRFVEDGALRSLALTPERYGRLRGPYNRRNAYGAVVAYGPVLVSRPRTRALFESVARHALCPTADDRSAPLLRELGVDPQGVQGPFQIVYTPREGTQTELPLRLEVEC